MLAQLLRYALRQTAKQMPSLKKIQVQFKAMAFIPLGHSFHHCLINVQFTKHQAHFLMEAEVTAWERENSSLPTSGSSIPPVALAWYGLVTALPLFKTADVVLFPSRTGVPLKHQKPKRHFYQQKSLLN